MALGVNRTWVKYIEKGSFPDVSRHFSVMRCNHCDDAPCIEICPTNALYRADNGVVDFNDSHCIGCKACMNACPYDAIYINPETNTANKCNFCNHRIEQGLEPSCVVVCPTHAISVADLDDPLDPVTSIIAREDVTVRAPEQNTKPKVYYRGADAASLDPLRTAIAPDGLIWADTTADHPTVPPVAGRPDARTTYTTAHTMTWRAKVSGYLVTKGVAAGMMLVAALLVATGHGELGSVSVMAPIVAGVFLAITGVLLVADLKQPLRFHYLLTRSNSRSWLVKGAYILMAFAVCVGISGIGGLMNMAGLVEFMVLPTCAGAIATAGYTAFLFAQCEGRDLWQTRLLGPTLLSQAVLAGAAGFAIADVFGDIGNPIAVRWLLVGACGVTAALIAAEVTSAHEPHVRVAVSEMTAGAYRGKFRVGVVGGVAIPALLTALAMIVGSGTATVLTAIAGVFALVGMWFYEDAFVRAGQSVPLS